MLSFRQFLSARCIRKTIEHRLEEDRKGRLTPSILFKNLIHTWLEIILQVTEPAKTGDIT